jgi:hypothetical protein
LSFLTDDFSGAQDKATIFAGDVTQFDTGVCTMGGMPIEFMGAYAPEANSDTSDATNS